MGLENYSFKNVSDFLQWLIDESTISSATEPLELDVEIAKEKLNYLYTGVNDTFMIIVWEILDSVAKGNTFTIDYTYNLELDDVNLSIVGNKDGIDACKELHNNRNLFFRNGVEKLSNGEWVKNNLKNNIILYDDLIKIARVFSS